MDACQLAADRSIGMGNAVPNILKSVKFAVCAAHVCTYQGEVLHGSVVVDDGYDVVVICLKHEGRRAVSLQCLRGTSCYRLVVVVDYR